MDELHQRVKVMLVLEAFVVLHDEGVVQGSQEILLLGNVLVEGVFFYLELAVALQKVKLLRLLFDRAADQKVVSELAVLQLLQHH